MPESRLSCRRLNISQATLYQWRRKYAGLDVRQLHRLKELEEENAKLKCMRVWLSTISSRGD